MIIMQWNPLLEIFFGHVLAGDSLIPSIFNTFLCSNSLLNNISGFLDRGQMFVFSEKQFESMVKEHIQTANTIANNFGTRIGGSLLDVGAGDGNITSIMANYFDYVTATEVSSCMALSIISCIDLLKHFRYGHQTENKRIYSV